MRKYNGFIVVDKPRNMGSTDVVRKIKKIFNMKKVGHSGTLDPLATGVLVICLGKATKTIEYLQTCNKTYIARMVFGKKTDTLDIKGKVTKESDKKIKIEDIEGVLDNYIGTIKQIPPMYSALKVDGKRLYELAREGIEIERKSRTTNIYDIEIIDFDYDNQFCDIKVECSAGTYIRTLIDDIGDELGSFAYMSDLRRIKCSGFTIDDSVDLDNEEKVRESFLDLNSFPKIMDEVIVDDDTLNFLLNGMTSKLDVINNPGKYIIKNNKNIVGRGNLFSSDKGKMLKLEKHLYDHENN